MTYHYTVPGIPPSFNSSIGRKNVWGYRAWKDEWTHKAYWCCKAGVIPKEPLEKAHVTITGYFADRRRRDMDNIAKPILDGIVSAGVIKDDCWTCATITLSGAVDKKNPRMEIEVTDTWEKK